MDPTRGLGAGKYKSWFVTIVPMKPLLVLFVISVTHAFGDVGKIDVEVDSLVNMDAPSRVEQIQSMPSEHRKELIAAVKALPIPGYRIAEYDALLVHLGDEATIRKEAELMIQLDDSLAFGALTTARDPQVIAAICPVFLLDPIKVELVYAVSNQMLYRMLLETPGFSPAVYDWVAKLKADPNSQAPWIFREWWKANEGAFKRKDYKAVKPVTLQVTDPAILYTPPPEPPAPVQKSRPTDQPQTPAVIAPNQVASSRGKNYFVAGVLLAIIITGATILLRRRK